MIKIYRNYPTKILVDKEDLMKVFLASENEIAEIDESNFSNLPKCYKRCKFNE